ncbi:hypothetical protein SASPL_136495 [Salvia splendens]|uniref:Protein FAR1-RELATED SEQUENCE n=1 Tax=Salvia splendens TaxID=180675 RepID=A0A8X8WYB0_SALSN|nr:hypothetical protein SASPL_136495 [Salvia splendens]
MRFYKSHKKMILAAKKVQPSEPLEREFLPPMVGLEFESFDEAYDFYNVYAKRQGFGIRVSNSWFRSKRRERYRAKLSCSSAGFKKKSEANNPRPETRTGCPAMLIIKLVDAQRWRIVEVELAHNHPLSPESMRFYKSHKKMILAAKKAQPSEPVREVHTIKLYRTAVADGLCRADTRNERNSMDHSNHLILKEGDSLAAFSEVFPQACHCYCLSYIMLRVPEKLGGLNGFEVIKRRFSKAVFGSLTISEFETFWREMISQHNLRENKWLQAFEGEGTTPFFDGYVHKHTSSKEFLDKYDMVLQRKYLKEAMGDVESRNLASELKTGSNFELQLSKQVAKNAPILTFVVEQRQKAEANEKDVRHYEVLYETTQVEVGCICGLFNFKGYLCRHALSVLSHNGVEEIPSQYILRRWSKDYKRRFLSDGAIGEDSPWEWHEHLLRRSLQVVEEGAQSEDHYEVMMQDMNGQELYMQ